jgi:hypothetical protein
VGTAPAFREAFKTRRCLVPADAFYEWQKIDVKTKQPFAIGMKDGSPYPFAGLWERWKDAATKERLRGSQSSPQTRMKWPSRCTIACTASCSGGIMTLGSLRKTRSVLLSIYCGLPGGADDRLEGGSQGRQREERHGGLHRAHEHMTVQSTIAISQFSAVLL